MFKSKVIALIGWILLSQLAGAIGSTFTFSAIPSWYSTLTKPSFTPPGWLFAPVWTILYTLMGIAAWLVWRQLAINPAVKMGITLFLIQLALNALWSVIFFGLHAPGLAFVEIVVLWASIILTTVWFFRASIAAGVLMLPYIIWVSFASILNFAIWRLNS